MSNTPAAGLTAPEDAVVSPTELDARRELGREFRIERLLAQSPIQYLARDPEDRLLAVTVVPRARFERPAEQLLEPVAAAVGLDHPHIARVQSSGTTDSFLWYATPYVEGRTLASLLRTVRSMELAACLRIFEQVASALDYAHWRGVSHGALTAECIVVDSNEWVLVGDFGAAELLSSVASGDVTPATDQRALALLAHQCLTGGDRSGGLPLHVSQALRRAMSTQTTDQFPSVLDFVAALDDRGGGSGGGRTVRVTPDVVRLQATPLTWRPLVIPDADQDPVAATRRIGGRVLAAVALLGVCAVVAAWITWSSAPTPPPSRAAPSAAATPPSPPPAPPAPPPPAPAPVPSVAAASPPKPSSRPHSVAGPVVPARTPARAPAPVRATPPALAPGRRTEPGLLSINAIPWGSVYIDGRPVGNTPQLDLPVSPGQHRLRVEREGYRPYERMIDVAPGQHLRITDITLTER